jgi:site-specific DNA-methyltransferase (adenine-specific)
MRTGVIDIKNVDCLEFLSELGDDTVDLVIVDPPYYKIVKNDWDCQWKDEAEYIDWCRCWTREAARVLKPRGCLYVWGTTKTDTFLRYKLEVLNLVPELEYQNWIIWGYDWGGRTRKKFPRKHEDLLMYSKGKEFLFNADDVRIPYKMQKNTYRQKTKGNTNHKLGKIPTDVWMKNNHTVSKEYAGWHPTQKPISLLARIIKAHTNTGDVVCDFFSGSGSTAIAAGRTSRRFIGCELDEEYYAKSIERIDEMLSSDS